MRALLGRAIFGGYFVWRPDDARPLLLIAGGSGIVPLMAMIRLCTAARRAVSSAVFRAPSGERLVPR